MVYYLKKIMQFRKADQEDSLQLHLSGSPNSHNRIGVLTGPFLFVALGDTARVLLLDSIAL